MRFRNYAGNFLFFAFIDGLKSIFIDKKAWVPAKNSGSYEQYQQTAYHLRRKGYLKIIRPPGGNQKFLQLTRKGELELLFVKAWLTKKHKWDGKWRLVIFDIPEAAHKKRDKLRRILKNAGFVRLQASVYIHPYPLNREAVSYLKISGLIAYIRIGRLEELDDDADLIKHFKLVKPA